MRPLHTYLLTYTELFLFANVFIYIYMYIFATEHGYNAFFVPNNSNFVTSTSTTKCNSAYVWAIWGFTQSFTFYPVLSRFYPITQFVWLGGVAVGRRIRDQEVASSIPSCSAARCNSGQVVHTHVPLFTKQYKLVPASAGE